MSDFDDREDDHSDDDDIEYSIKVQFSDLNTFTCSKTEKPSISFLFAKRFNVMHMNKIYQSCDHPTYQ